MPESITWRESITQMKSITRTATLLNSTVIDETQFQSKQNKTRCERFVYLLYCGIKKKST